MAFILLCLMACAATPTPADLHLQRYADAAAEAGCPWDQVENFLRAGIVLQPRQLAACAAARLCDEEDGPTEIGYGGARGGGKSHWGIAQLAADDCQRCPGLKALVLRKIGKANRENFDDLRRRLLMGLEHDYRRQEGVVEFANGSRIITGHFQHEKDIDAYLGLEYDVILTEEATTLTKGKADDIGSCNRTSKIGWRPRMYSTTNSGGVGHSWYKAKFVQPSRKHLETDTRFIPATADDNAFINPEYRKKLDGLTGWKLRSWRYGDWDIAAGQFFTTFRRDIHVIPRLAPLPAHWRVWLGFDGAGEILRRLGDVDEGIRASLFICEPCVRLIECLPSLEHDPHRPEDVLKVDTDEEGNGGDDPYDALRYGVMHAKPRGQIFMTDHPLQGRV
jgi:hypothetical protein